MLIEAEDPESMEATLESLADPAAQARLASSEQEIAAGDVLDEAEVRASVVSRRQDRSG